MDDQTLRFIEKVQETRFKNAELFEKNIIYLSGGAIALVFSQIKEIQNFHCKILFVISFVSLTSTLFVSLLGYLLAVSFGGRYIKDITFGNLNSKTVTIRNTILNFLNYTSLLMFLVAASLLCYFVTINVL